MSKNGPIILIEDDTDDMELFKSALHDLEIRNEVKWFGETESAIEFLLQTDEIVYLIFCDINLPRTNGIEFKRKIDENETLRKKSIPFLFYSTAAKQQDVDEAYTELVVQGFFKKQYSYDRMKDMLRIIFDYWKMCRHPNNKD